MSVEVAHLLQHGSTSVERRTPTPNANSGLRIGDIFAVLVSPSDIVNQVVRDCHKVTCLLGGSYVVYVVGQSLLGLDAAVGVRASATGVLSSIVASPITISSSSSSASSTGVGTSSTAGFSHGRIISLSVVVRMSLVLFNDRVVVRYDV